MARKSDIDHSKVKITHHFADGTVTDSLEGVYVPYEGNEYIYNTIVQVWKDVMARTAAKEAAAAKNVSDKKEKPGCTA